MVPKKSIMPPLYQNVAVFQTVLPLFWIKVLSSVQCTLKMTKLKSRDNIGNGSKTELAWREYRMSGWQQDWSGNDFKLCTPVSPCLLFLSSLVSLVRGAWVTRHRESSKLQGHLNLKCDTLVIENFIVYASIHCWHCNALHCSEFCLLHILESPCIVCWGYRSHALGIERPKTAFGIRLCALNC